MNPLIKKWNDDWVERGNKLRQQAEEMGLVVETPEGRTFNFELNFAPIKIANPTPERVYMLVVLAKEVAGGSRVGEHNALLSLTTEREGLKNREHISWSLNHYSAVNSEKLIALDEWLEANGQDISQF